MTKNVVGNYIRAHRRRLGLTQRELGVLVGYRDGFAVGRHERSSSAPPLIVALAYEALFDIPTAKIFSGFYTAVARSVERNQEDLKAEFLKLRGTRGESKRHKTKWLLKEGSRPAAI